MACVSGVGCGGPASGGLFYGSLSYFEMFIEVLPLSCK